MELKDLNQDECLALVALIEATVQADRAVSGDEQERLDEVIDELGEERYEEAAAQADQRFESDDDLKTFLGGIKRPEARELIYGVALDMAMSDVVTGHEAPLLAWVASSWNIQTTIEDE